MSDNQTMVTVIREAITNHRQLVFTAKRYHREFCPHVLGTKSGVWHVFGWQFGGGTNQGKLPEGGDWRCIELRDISSPILARDGAWYRGWTKGRRGQTCVDFIDTEVDQAHAAEALSTLPSRTPRLVLVRTVPRRR
jgi:hypothetical protein